MQIADGMMNKQPQIFNVPLFWKLNLLILYEKSAWDFFAVNFCFRDIFSFNFRALHLETKADEESNIGWKKLSLNLILTHVI